MIDDNELRRPPHPGEFCDADEDRQVAVTTLVKNFGAVAEALIKLDGCAIEARLGCLDTVLVDVDIGTAGLTRHAVAAVVTPLGGTLHDRKRHPRGTP